MKPTRVMCGYQRRLPFRRSAYCNNVAAWRVFFHWPIGPLTDKDGGATNTSRCGNHRAAKWLPKGVIVTKEEFIGRARPDTENSEQRPSSTEPPK